MCTQVTHGIHWLPLLDEVYVLKSNRVAEHGSYEALLSHNGEFAEFVREYFLNGKMVMTTKFFLFNFLPHHE